MSATPDAFQAVADRLRCDASLWSDFQHLCSLGGRLAGGDGDLAAADFCAAVLSASGAQVSRVGVPFEAWQARRAEVSIADQEALLPCRALLRSASTRAGGLVAPVLDLGRGSEEDFARHRQLLPGRIALVLHEYPFSDTHIHRRRKYGWARDHGCAAFLIANPIPGGGLLSGSSGREAGAPGIPAAYITFETANALRLASSRGVSALLRIDGVDRPAIAPNVIGDFAGSASAMIVLSAHLDGHDLAQSALDNASGVAVSLAVARALSPMTSRFESGLRVCQFSAEEWALTGSAKYLAALSAEELGRMRLNINLDTVGGDESLTALVGGSERMARLVKDASVLSGIDVATHWPLMENSDHANFARAGIPALRLVAGFNRPHSEVRHILSAHDTPDKVRQEDLIQAALAAAAMVLCGMQG